MRYSTSAVLLIIPVIISVSLIAFILWMFWDMLHNEYLTSNVRVLWIFGFIFVSVLTAGYYYFTEYRIRR